MFGFGLSLGRVFGFGVLTHPQLLLAPNNVVFSVTADMYVSPSSLSFTTSGVPTTITPNAFQDILILGASIMEYSMKPVETKALMDATYPNSNCTVYNEAIAGWKTPNLRAEIDSILANYTPTINDMAVVMHIGGGDVSEDRPYATDGTTNIIEDDIDYIINAVETAGYTLYMADLTYRNYVDVETNNEDNGSLPYNTNIMNPRVNSSKRFSDGQSWMQFYTVFYNDISLLNTDGVHPLGVVGETAMRQRLVDTLGYHNFTGNEPTRVAKTDFYVAPEAVTDITLSNSAQSVTVTWTDSNINAYSYNIYREGVLVATEDNVLGQSSDYSIIDDASTAHGTTVTYEVKAVNDTGESVGNAQPTIDVPEITVSTGPIYDVSLNDGSTAPSYDAPAGITINDVAGVNAIDTPMVLLDNDGVDNESITIQMITKPPYDSATQGLVTGDDSGYLYDRQLEGAFYYYDTDSCSIEVAGLDTGATYDFYLMSSRNDNKTDRHIVFTCGSEDPITVDAMYNTENGATFSGISPDGNGKVLIGGTVLTDDLIAYFNGFRIQKTA